MKRETLPSVRRVPLLPLALLLLPLASCLTPESVDCPPDLVCPAGQRCAAKQPACIKDDCGDGVIQASETCDDGNVEDGDGCSKTCKSDESCGNSVIDVTTAGGVTRREACDDGNNVDGDGCSSDCLSSELCGNNIVDKATKEVCDDNNELNGDGCSADCQSTEVCGNNVIDYAIGEVCDDGNNMSGDGCSSDCRSGEQCGNAKLDPGEECEDGNTVNEDSCTATCHQARCGDGIVKTDAEKCDPGTNGNSPTCNFNCTRADCGDGIVNASAGEQCDDSNTVDTDGCTNNCRIAWCGDGVKNGAEECDPGIDPTCNYNCKKNQCGDGIVNAKAGEVCDDGNYDACGTCSDKCTTRQDESTAIGRIIAVPAANINGETLTFKEPLGELVFEFDKNGTVEEGNVRIDIDGLDQSDQVAMAIEAAINKQFAEKKINFRVSSRSWNVVMLEYTTDGKIDDNTNITETVGVKGFSAEILSRGSGYNCMAGMGCSGDKDCKSRRCTIATDKLTGICQP